MFRNQEQLSSGEIKNINNLVNFEFAILPTTDNFKYLRTMFEENFIWNLDIDNKIKNTENRDLCWWGEN